ncbi:CLUMA_CG018989, isoform A [Clunio marinus]|uniref:CLUMA_CG018989, isoform A n=1 Tax=Clunio marinus TaxID=568069 RepID=A0A1J1J496_9DIPT|nr:CLUMA_CG018989, isoform A [Clunio marinus]
MSDDESKAKVAGRPPAVKAGGMRIVQHKTPNTERAARSSPLEVVGFNQNNPIDSVEQISTSPSQKTTVESSQVAHAPKPPVSVPHKPMNNIQQPRK